jgi:hypothetical protein
MSCRHDEIEAVSDREIPTIWEVGHNPQRYSIYMIFRCCACRKVLQGKKGEFPHLTWDQRYDLFEKAALSPTIYPIVGG